MDLFVTGATGYIGSAVAARLVADGHRITALARSDAAAQTLRAAGYTPTPGDLVDAGAISRAATAADGVVHLASPNDETSGAADRISVDAVLAALDGTDKPFLYTSGLWLHGSSTTVIDESSPLDPPLVVAWRPAIEADVLAAARTGIRTVSIRPGIVYGQGGGIPAMLAGPAAAAGHVVHIGDGTNRWSPIHVADLAELYLRALDAAPAGRVYLGVSGEIVSVHDVAQAAARGAGVPGAVRSWPLDDARAAMGPFADALVLDQPATSERAATELSWHPAAAGLLVDLEHGSYAVGHAA